MSIFDLVLHIDKVLETNPSVIIDDATFQQVTAFPLALTREIAHRSAWVIVQLRRDLYASAEAFLDAETMTEARTYLICARSKEAYEECSRDLRAKVEKNLEGQTERFEYYHLHDSPEEAACPSPLIMPDRKSKP